MAATNFKMAATKFKMAAAGAPKYGRHIQGM